MGKEHLEKALSLKMQKPFVPFRVITKDGKSYRVDNWLQIAVTDNLVCYADPKTKWFVEVKANDIADVEVVKRKRSAA